MKFRELTDEQWGFIKPLLPPQLKGRGRPRADDRAAVNAILYVLTTGCRWMDLPRDFGIWYSTAWRRLKRWEEQGVWRRLLKAIIDHGYALGRLSLEAVAVDSTDVAAKKGGSSLVTMATRRSRVQRYTPLLHQMPSQ